MNKKILYITCSNKNNLSGGTLCANRNLDCIIDIFGEKNVETFILSPQIGRRSVSGKFIKLVEIFKFYGGGLTSSYLGKIMKMMNENKFQQVFIDSSNLGVIAKYIKSRFPQTVIYTFFHNVEYDYMISTTLMSGDFKHLFWIANARYNEYCACKYSSTSIVLNAKDKKRISHLYKAQNISIIPITLKDNCTYNLKKESKIISTTPKLLFVGSYFPGNTKGLKWFCKKILPHVNAHLTIVGSGMEQLKKTIKIDCNKLTIHGKVDKLDSFYLNADIIILPIISGGGMKVKTAEALMWGKYIIGTKEALEGYNLNKDIAIICQTKQDFIKAINNIGSKQKYNYNEQARMIFENNYSYNYSLFLYKNIFKII